MVKKQTTAHKRSRKKKEHHYKSFKLARKIKPTKPLPGFFSLFKVSLSLIRRNKRLFIGIVVINSLLSLIFVAGLNSSFDFVQTKQEVEGLIGQETGQVGTTLALFGYLLGSVGNQASEVAGTYQLFLNLITSLAAIWAIRQLMAGEPVTAKEAYYRGLYPLIPVILVLLVIALQLLPAITGASLYGIVLAGGLAVTAIEKVLWLLLFLLGLLLSLYMLASSLFAFYIATLPDMTPLRSLRSARSLVMHRRLGIGLRLVALLLLMTVGSLILIAPIIIWLPWLTVVFFLVISSFMLVLTHTYIYKLYRELL